MLKKIDQFLMHALISLYAISCFYISWNVRRPSLIPLCIICIFGLLACFGYSVWKKKGLVLFFIPFVFVFVFTQFQHGLDGFFSWINVILEQYNAIYEKGIPLLNAQNSSIGIQTFSLLFSLFQIYVLYFILHTKRKKTISYIYLLLWSVLLLVINAFYPLLFALFLITWISLFVGKMTNLTRHWLYCVSVLVLIISFFWTSFDNSWMHTFKEDTSNKVHEVRYGNNVLPSGDLSQANLLSRGKETRLTVTSNQIKDLYVKAYVGSLYKENQWETLSDADYGYDNKGMFTWLKNHNFDPFTQVSTYYSLGKDTVKKNHVSISVQSASRDYLYSVSSLKNVSLKSTKEVQDYNLLTKGLFGKDDYSWDELSTDKPYELMTSSDWLQNPTTKKQKEYIQAESVYRQFVYDHYLKVDRDTNSFLKSYFWKEYDAKENDSIYSAIQQIRTTLEKNTTYEAQMDTIQNKDVVKYFLSQSKKGNSAFYATVATLALRSQGIPARYVEGYFVSKESLENNRSVKVSSQDSHAWTEIYYDGIGWVPVDFTPGFYDEAVVLQKMVSLPNTVHKTAGVRKNKTNKADEMYSKNKKGAHALKDAVKHVVNVLGMALGIVAILALLFTLLFVLIEIIKAILVRKFKYKYDKASSSEKVLILKRMMDVCFAILNLPIDFGLNIQEADILLASSIENISRGDFERIAYLVEKSVYGGMDLEEFELRTIQVFIQKLYDYGIKQSLWTRIQMHYSIWRVN